MQNTEDMKNTGLIQTMKVLIFAEGIDGDIIRSCLKEKESFAGFIYETDLKKDRNGEAGRLYDDVWIIVRDMEHFN